MPTRASTAIPSCYRHPSVSRTARCALCGRPICSHCTPRTPAGASCIDCGDSSKRRRPNETAVPRRPIIPRRPSVPMLVPSWRVKRRRRRLSTVVAATVVVVGCVVVIPSVRAPAAVYLQSIAARIRPHRVAPPVAVTTSGTHAFMATVAGQPVTYDPCHTIRYALNLNEAPAGSEAVLGNAINEVERATGLRFEYVGITHREPLDKEPTTSRFGIKDAPPVTISWATPAEAPMLAGDIAGYAGSSYLVVDGRPTHYVTGRVVLDAPTYASLVQSPAGAAEARAITMHELGHLVGLAHVDDPAELMYRKNTGQQQFGAGDLAGLARLGNGRC